MKKVLLLIFLFASKADAQLVETTPAKEEIIGQVDASLVLEKVTRDSLTLYVLFYRNEKYSSIMDEQYIYFKPETNILNRLYYILQGVFFNGKEAAFDLGEHHVTVNKQNDKIILFIEETYFSLTYEQLNKLFGK